MLQFDSRPEQWRELLAICAHARGEGARVVAQFAARPFGILAGHQTVANPFLNRPAYAEIADLPLPERVARLRDPERRRRILGPERVGGAGFGSFLDHPGTFARLFPLGDPPDYEPGPERSLAAIATREGRPAEEVLYDHLLRDEGRELLLLPLFNYSHGSLDFLHEILLSPDTVVSLGDGGAHCGVICDASLTTFLLTHWVRDRTRGARVPLELAVRRMTSETARLYGLLDRGVLAPGHQADLNVIDWEALRLHRPEMAYDLPGGARRLLQRADGYEATILRGEVVMERGEPTGATPGRLLRGPQPAP
jgi:N-acyl-D-aspartate/D-glutamate deacylase